MTNYKLRVAAGKSDIDGDGVGNVCQDDTYFAAAKYTASVTAKITATVNASVTVEWTERVTARSDTPAKARGVG